ncbi:WD40 repeat domain-containing protein [Allorhodopirellula solitaria]|uniref:SLA1 homology domain-containing protein n=1 Tax=Allorhodopirellula solitaria TaxID=2527987 RepID=A0A5C5YIR5_9BACT|nr:hypothetical protein [Allorhodopirellula solitaria]TWT74757.1 hypothetical protein CA85_00420 [Allorhodopirellula solitaria]
MKTISLVQRLVLMSVCLLCFALPAQGQLPSGLKPSAIADGAKVVLNVRAEDAPKVTELRDWQLEGRGPVQGRLVQWIGPDNWIHLEDQFQRIQSYPLRQFSESDRDLIEETLGPWRQLVDQLRQDFSIRAATDKPWAQGDRVLSNASLLSVDEDMTFWNVQRELIAIPLTSFRGEQRDLIQERLRVLGKLSVWQTQDPGVAFRAALLGEVDDAYVFGRIWKPHALYPVMVRFRVRKDMLADADRERAGSWLKTGKVKRVPGLEQTELWCWPGRLGMLGPGQPLEIVEDEADSQGKVSWLVPDHRPKRARFRNFRIKRWESIGSFNGPSELDLRRQLFERKLQEAEPEVSSERIAEAWSEQRQSLVQRDPFRYLNTTLTWRLKDTAPNSRVTATLIGERHPFYVYRFGAEDLTAAVLKSELAEPWREVAEQTVQRLNEYFEAHPKEKRPSLHSEYFIVRRSHAALLLIKPLEVASEANWKVKMAGRDTPVVLPADQLHYIDAMEMNLMMLESEPGSSAEEMPQRAKASREDRIQWSKLQEHFEKKTVFGLQLPSAKSMEDWSVSWHQPLYETQVGFDGVVVGKHLDSWIVRDGTVDFLIDTELMTDHSNEQASQQWQALKEQFPNQAIPIGVPTLRIYGLAGKTPLPPAEDPSWSDDEGWQYTDREGNRQSIPKAAFSHLEQLELEVQLRSESEVRRTVSTEDEYAATQQVDEFQENLRRELEEELRSLPRSPSFQAWHLADSKELRAAHFERFDGEDVIMLSSLGVHFRIARSLFQEQALKRMEELTAEFRQQGKAGRTAGLDPSTVTHRSIRRADGRTTRPGTPIRANRYYIDVENEEGLLTQLSVDELHPVDGSELRAELYRREHGIEWDDQVDERLAMPVTDDEIIARPATLEAQYRRRLETLLGGFSRKWKETQLELSPDQTVQQISVDGSFLLISGNNPSVVDPAGKTVHRIPRQWDEQHPVYLSPDSNQLIGFESGVLTVWDLQQQTKLASFQAVTQPLASTQCADGDQFAFTARDGSIYFLDLASMEVKRSRIELRGDERMTEQLWCSSDGQNVIATSNQNTYLLKLDEATGKIANQDRLKKILSIRAMAVLDQRAWVSTVEQPWAIDFGVEEGKLVHATRQLGVIPHWMKSVDADEGIPLVEVIGMLRGLAGSEDPYAFVSYFDFNAHPMGVVQYVNCDLTQPVMIAGRGKAMVFRRGDQWIHAVAPEQINADRILRVLAEDLIDSDRIDQLDAAFAYLRTPAIAELSEYPDELSEEFLNALDIVCQEYGWVHGGDPRIRKELWLKRAGERMPRSIVIPMLRAQYHSDLAWEARGSGFVNTVSNEGMQTFHEQLTVALEHLKPLLKKQQPGTRVFSLSLSFATGLSAPKEAVGELFQRAMQTPAKSSLEVHSATVNYLLPRWHGNPGDFENYIERVCEQLGGADGDAMYARLIVSIARYYPSGQPASDFMRFDPDRVLAGMDAYYAKDRTSTRWFELAERLFQREQDAERLSKLQQLIVRHRIYFGE